MTRDDETQSDLLNIELQEMGTWEFNGVCIPDFLLVKGDEKDLEMKN